MVDTIPHPLATGLPSPPLTAHDRLSAGPVDVEAFPPLSQSSTVASERDPLLLRSRIQSDEQVTSLRRRGSRKHKGTWHRLLHAPK
jgi:hypothetical protein